MKEQALVEAQEKARIILDRNLATHAYFADHLKPSVFKITNTFLPDGYFDPAWMSSTYAIHKIENYFNALTDGNYYYKECAINARNPSNEADEFERGIFEKIQTAPEKIQWDGIRQFKDGKYFVLIRRSETITESCLMCHSSPKNAPEDLVRMYGPSRSFGRTQGELVSVASIRIPMEDAYQHADHVTREILFGFLVMVTVLFAGIHFFNRHFFMKPLTYFKKRSEAVAGKEKYHPELDHETGLRGEWHILKTAFDDMTASINQHENELNNQVEAALIGMADRHKQLEDEVAAHRKTAERLKLESDIVNHIKVGLYVYHLKDLDDDRTLVLIDANPATENMTGVLCRDIIGKTIDENFPALRERDTPRFYADVVRSGKPADLGDFYYEDKRVQAAWYQVKAFPLPNQCMGVSFDNITPRRRIEDELAKQKNQLQALFDHMLNGFAFHRIITDQAGSPIDYCFLDVNPAFERLTGLNRNAILGKCVTEIHPGIEKSAFDWIGIYGQVALTGEPIQFEQYFMPQDHWYLISAYCPMAMHFAVTFEDISHQKKAEQEKIVLETQLRQAQKIEAIGVLAGGIAHDFNNILFPILGFAEMIRDDLAEGSPIKEHVLEIINGTKRARDLVKQILTFSRQEEGLLQPMKAHIIIKEVIRLVRSTFPSTITINQSIDSDCGAIFNDPTRIHQILMNLVTNAYHAMEENGGVLTIQLKRGHMDDSAALLHHLEPGNYAVITVADTGQGMSSETLEKIFDPYFTTKEEGKGTGLGLSLVYGIVKASGGHILVTSKAGNGTQFDIYFPECDIDQKIIEKTDTQHIFRGYSHVLVIDDEFPVANIGKQIMERLGYRVTVRTSSIEALELFKNRPDDFDVVFTDMTMPNMTGDRLSKEIKNIRPDIPVVLCTGYSSRMTAEKAKKLGIDALVYKPLLLTEVSETLFTVLDKKGVA